ncbi:hypothetical protein DMENIID0001_116770 [Sergentomyia squamirostris]
MFYTPRLIISGKIYKVKPDLNLLGSSKINLMYNVIVLENQTIDGKHAVFKFDIMKNTTQIMDLFSKEGTFVDQEQLLPVTWKFLEHGQKILFGTVEGIFLTESDILVPQTQDLRYSEEDSLENLTLPETQLSRSNSFSDLETRDEELNEKIAALSEDAFAPKCKDEFVPETQENPRLSESMDDITLPETQFSRPQSRSTPQSLKGDFNAGDEDPVESEVFELIPNVKVSLSSMEMESQNLLADVPVSAKKIPILQDVKPTRIAPVEISKKLILETADDGDSTDCDEELEVLARSTQKTVVTREVSVTPELEELHHTEQTIFRRPGTPEIPSETKVKKPRLELIENHSHNVYECSTQRNVMYDIETQKMDTLKSFYEVETQRESPDSDVTQPFNIQDFHKPQSIVASSAGSEVYDISTQLNDPSDVKMDFMNSSQDLNEMSSQSSQLSTPPLSFDLPKTSRTDDLQKVLQKRQINKKTTGLTLGHESSDEDDFATVLKSSYPEMSLKSPKKVSSTIPSKRMRSIMILDSESPLAVLEPEEPQRSVVTKSKALPKNLNGNLSVPDPPADNTVNTVRRSKRKTRKVIRPDYHCDLEDEDKSPPKKAKIRKSHR